MLFEQKYNKNIAFTLSEVLLTLGIIGIVAAMTIPTLINNARESSNLVALSKAYAILEGAFRRGFAQYGSPELWCHEYQNASDNCFMNRLLQQTIVVKNCNTGNGCFADGNYKKIDGSDFKNINSDSNLGKFILQDGMMVAISSFVYCNQERGDSASLQHVCANIYIDVNGAKKPNQLGVDLFLLYLTQFGIEPAGNSLDTTNPFSTTCKTGSGEGCSAWALINKNYAYRYCDGIDWGMERNNCDYLRFGGWN